MKQRLICYDIDGTLTSEMLFVPLVTAEHRAGILSDQSYTSIAETLKLYKSGQIAYEDAVQVLIEKHAAGLSGVELHKVEDHATEFVRGHNELFRPSMVSIIDVLKNDSTQVVVTAEPLYLASAVIDHLSLDQAYATEYEVFDGKLTGKVAKSLAHRSQKAELLTNRTIYAAFGDSEGDIDMLARAKYPICVQPTDDLRAEAEVHDWLLLSGMNTDIEAVAHLINA